MLIPLFQQCNAWREFPEETEFHTDTLLGCFNAYDFTMLLLGSRWQNCKIAKLAHKYCKNVHFYSHVLNSRRGSCQYPIHPWQALQHPSPINPRKTIQGILYNPPHSSPHPTNIPTLKNDQVPKYQDSDVPSNTPQIWPLIKPKEHNIRLNFEKELNSVTVKITVHTPDNLSKITVALKKGHLQPKLDWTGFLLLSSYI